MYLHNSHAYSAWYLKYDPRLVPGPHVDNAVLVSMGDDGISVSGAFSLVVAVDFDALTVTLATPRAAPQYARSRLQPAVQAVWMHAREIPCRTD